MINYHKVDSRIMNFDLESIEFKFGMWITKKEFGQRLNTSDPLPIGQFTMSRRLVANEINTTEMVIRRLIKQFIEIGIIRLVEKSKKVGKGSVYEYLVALENGENIQPNGEPNGEPNRRTQYKPSKNEGLDDINNPMKNPMENPMDNPNKNKNKTKLKEKEKIYIDLSFVSKSIDKVFLEQHQYNDLLEQFGPTLLHNKIIQMNSWIDNGKRKGKPYENSYKELLNWCNKDKNKEQPKQKGNAGCYKKFNANK